MSFLQENRIERSETSEILIVDHATLINKIQENAKHLSTPAPV
jgi:hypothetical protein